MLEADKNTFEEEEDEQKGENYSLLFKIQLRKARWYTKYPKYFHQ